MNAPLEKATFGCTRLCYTQQERDEIATWLNANNGDIAKVFDILWPTILKWHPDADPRHWVQIIDRIKRGGPPPGSFTEVIDTPGQ